MFSTAELSVPASAARPSDLEPSSSTQTNPEQYKTTHLRLLNQTAN